MSENFNKYYQFTYYWTFLGFIAVLPMSGTIALRNIFLVLMLCLFLYGNIFFGEIRKKAFEALKNVPIALILWIVYLCIFPFWAPMPEIAWENLRGQWGESIAAWVVGLGAIVILGSRRPGILSLAMASAFPLFVHLFLAVLAYIGFFSDNFYQFVENRSLDGLYAEVINWLNGGMHKLNPHHPLEEGFKGIEVMHGNLGYTSSVAVALLTANLFGVREETNIRTAFFSILFIGLCFLSLLIARSRGALIFNAVIICVGIFWGGATKFFQDRRVAQARKTPAIFGDRNLLVLFSLFMLLCLGLIGLKTDPRWSGMVDRIAAGFQIADPTATLCFGLSTEEEALIRNRLSSRSTSYVDEVVSNVRDGDGGRVVLMREGALLAFENPWGLDGSRQSYERLIRQRCNGKPQLDYSHSHNSWFDMSMAIGFLGVILFAAIFISFYLSAFNNFLNLGSSSVAMASGLIALFWFFRGFFDSLYREHYLEMQAVILIYLHLSLLCRIQKTNDI